MPGFIVIQDINEIKLSNDWIDSIRFRSHYKGRQYCLIAKERVFSTGERARRGILGVAAIVISLGCALLLKPVRKLFTKEKKKIRFAAAIPSPVNQTNNPVNQFSPANGTNPSRVDTFFQEAKSAYEKACSENKADAETFNIFIKAAAQKGDFLEAKFAFEKACRENVADAETFNTFIQAADQAGKTLEAQQAREEKRRMFPS